MDNQVRVGVIGAGGIVNMLHIPNLKNHPQAVVKAICSRTREHAESVAKTHKIPEVFTDYREMIEKGNLDAIVIATPDDLHYEMTMESLNAGLHVLCEKPLAVTVAQAAEMTEKAEAISVKHMVFFTRRWRPDYRYIKELLDQGFIGRPYHASFRHLGGYGRQPSYGWRFDRQRSNGILGDLGSHLIDLAHWFIGDIDKVSAHLGTYVERSGPEGSELDPANDSAMLLLQFENGAQGSLHVSAVACTSNRYQEQHTILHGASGTLEFDSSMEGSDWSKMIFKTTCELRGARKDDPNFEVIPVPDRVQVNSNPPDSRAVSNLLSSGAQLFIDAIIEDKPITPNFIDGLKVQQVIEAAIQSHEQGRWITLQS